MVPHVARAVKCCDVSIYVLSVCYYLSKVTSMKRKSGVQPEEASDRANQREIALSLLADVIAQYHYRQSRNLSATEGSKRTAQGRHQFLGEGVKPDES